MEKPRLLSSWIGNADLYALAENLDGKPKERVLASLPPRSARSDRTGPIQTLLEHEPFDEVHLLSNFSKFATRQFANWLNGSVTVHDVKLDNPTDYPQIYRHVQRVLQQITTTRKNTSAEMCIHLSPGSPAMAAIWVLLGKSQFPATFYQTHEGRSWVTDIPFDLDVHFREMLQDTDRALQHLSSQAPGEIQGFDAIIGESRAIKDAAGRAARCALYDENVLLLGEPGTGKELFAEAIHEAGRRGAQSFLPVNCAAFPKDLLESELFGHVAGSFTGATKDRKGAFESANRGTLFLDEVGECDPDMQAKLLRVLQPPHGKGPCHRVFRRVGADRDSHSDVRVIAATNRNLVQAVTDGHFREDLYHRLVHLTVKLPPLRERGNDIRILAEKRLEHINNTLRDANPGYTDKRLATSALSFLRRHPWRGNVRELHHALMQAAVMASPDKNTIDRADLSDALGDTVPAGPIDQLELPLGDDFDLRAHLDKIQRHYLQRAMDEANGVKRHAAQLLGYSHYQTLDKQLKARGVSK